MSREITLRSDYLGDPVLSTVYFGGGTPSLLSEDELVRIIDRIRAHFSIEDTAEITLEANPDDLTAEKLRSLRRTGINRLSIGVQSFFDADLQWMNRSHSGAEARACLSMARDAGFDNLSADLIYGSPTTTDEMWQRNVEDCIALGIPHLSAYCLTVEEKTALHHRIARKMEVPPDSDKALRQFTFIQDELERNGYIHYEISNFSKEGREAVHNTSYWKGAGYLGIGPSAHSYNGTCRSWNVANNAAYMESLQTGRLPLETEVLTTTDRYNEYVMTSLRTIWGVEEDVIREFGQQYEHCFHSEIGRFMDTGQVSFDGRRYRLTKEGKAFADHIAAALFYVP